MTVLVAGASGATGKHVVEQLLIHKYKVSGKIAGNLEKQ